MKSLAIPAFASLLALAGCAAHKPIKVADPPTVTALKEWSAAVAEAINDNKLVTVGTDPKSRRDYAIAYSEAAVMSRYGALRHSLSNGRALTAIAFESLSLAATTAVPIVNGSRGKTILGALATGLTGTHMSIDRNLFREQSTGAILSAMETCVTRQRGVLAEKRALPVDKYLIFDAYSDLVTLLGCTTFAGAVQELSETQGAAAVAQRRVVAPVTTLERDAFETVQKEFVKSLDGDGAAARAFLTAMHVAGISAGTPREKLIDAYRELSVPALTKTADRATFFAEAKKAGLLPAN